MRHYTNTASTFMLGLSINYYIYYIVNYLLIIIYMYQSLKVTYLFACPKGFISPTYDIAVRNQEELASEFRRGLETCRAIRTLPWKQTFIAKITQLNQN